MPVKVFMDYFDPRKIMESGQCFRMIERQDSLAYETIAFGCRVAITSPEKGCFVFDCDQQEYERLWRGYFDLDTDYSAIIAAAPAEDAYLTRAIAYSHGMRILRQDPWETLCGFILSQRKHIKAIRACMESLCNAFGDPVEGTTRRSFPSPERLASLSEVEVRLCGLGYRTPYLLDAARKVASGELNLEEMASLPDDLLLDLLMKIKGVGIKVADCAMLFGFRRLSRAPVDVWIHRVIDEMYNGISPFEGYGEYAGIYQQYLFILRRDEGGGESEPEDGCACAPKPTEKRSKPK